MIRLRPFIAATSFLAFACLAGCVERRITIASDPPGALVYVNDVEMGRSPVTFPFTWYGDYDVRLRLAREEETAPPPHTVQYYLHTHRRASAPPFQWIGVDLFAEILPFDFKDEKIWAFTVPAVPIVSDDQLIAEARAMQSQLGPATTQPSATRPAANPPAPAK